MAEPRIDRAAWAALVSQLIATESPGNQTRFGQLIGVDRKTVRRWLAGEVDVSEEKVRAVARALHVSARDLLIQVGYYQADELPAPDRVDAPPADPQDPIEMVRQSDLSPTGKRELIEYLTEQRRRQIEEAQLEVKRLIDLARRTQGRTG